jgi:CPW-WPC domain-containing protein
MILFLFSTQILSANPMADILKQIASSVVSAVPPSDSSAAVRAMTAAALVQSETNLQQSAAETLLEDTVNRLVSMRVDAWVYTGMCQRNYTQPCPLGWEAGETRCGPSSDDPVSPCPSIPASLTSPQKEDAARRCRVHWPCAACQLDFAACPLEWYRGNSTSCHARDTYTGPCESTVDFKWIETDQDKAFWVARCHTQWPCQPVR